MGILLLPLSQVELARRAKEFAQEFKRGQVRYTSRG